MDRLQQGDKLSNIVVPGYPVRFQAALIDPRHEEVWKLIQYYASTVQIGDVCRQSTQLRFGVPFTSLRRQAEGLVRVGVRDAKKEVKAQVARKKKNEPNALFSDLVESVVFGSGVVIFKNQSMFVVKIGSEVTEGSGDSYAIKSLELPKVVADLPTADNIADGNMMEAFEVFDVGDDVSLNAMLMDGSKQAQYLVTHIWKSMDGFKPPAERRNILQAAIDMYNTHNAVFDTAKINILTPSFLIPSFDMAGIAAGDDDIAAGDDDIAAGDDDIAAADDIAAGDDDIAAGDDDNIAAGDDDNIAAEDDEAPRPMMGFKIASFAGTGAVASIRTLEDCCICRKPPAGAMVNCDNLNCPVKKFHTKCVGLADTPTDPWHCTNCQYQQ